MKLAFFRGRMPNFGDELNTLVWPQLLPPGFLDEDESELFVGIGSIIGTHLHPKARKFVFGSGYAGYMGLPDVHDGTWDIRFVRGPRTASLLHLPPDKAICDSAILLRAMTLPAPQEDIEVAFIPHYETLERGLWGEACRLAGITLIDPTQPAEKVLSQIRGARVIIAEAMHGAIVADALRVPWVAVRPLFWRHRSKWYDWSEALGVELRVHDLKPTNLLELYVGLSGRGGERGRANAISQSAAGRWPNAVLTYLAAKHLQKLARVEPQLSSDAAIQQATEKALGAVQAFVRARQAVS